MATTGFFSAWANNLDDAQKRTQDDQVKLRDRKADDIESAIKGIQQRGALQPGQPGYLSPEEVKFQIEEAQKQLSGLYQPHEAPDLLKRVKGIFSKGSNPAPDTGSKSAMSEVPPIQAGGVTIPGQQAKVALRPGMTLSEVLAGGAAPSARQETAGKILTPQPFQQADGNWYVLREKPDGSVGMEQIPGFSERSALQQLIDAGLSEDDAHKALRVKFGIEAKAGTEKTEKPMEPDIKGSLFMGVNDPNTGKKYSRAQLEKGDAPPEAVSIYKDYKTAKQEQQTEEEKKEDARVSRQLRTIQASFDRGDYVAARRELNKAKGDFEQATTRAKTMDQNIKEATDNPADQQAMMSLLANHIGMTLGAQKGARITRAVWEEALNSRPWLSGAKASFVTGSDGVEVLRGVVLTPDQMKQMVELAHDKVTILHDNISNVEKDYADDLAKGAAHEGKKPSNKKKPDVIVVSQEDMK